MFFIFGIMNKQKDLPFHQIITCRECGAYSRYQVYMTYMVLSLFFIPCLKWNRKYYVCTACCHTLYQLDSTIGKRIARGEQVEIRAEHLKKIGKNASFRKKCSSCGFSTWENFAYCPKCGRKMEG